LAFKILRQRNVALSIDIVAFPSLDAGNERGPLTRLPTACVWASWNRRANSITSSRRRRVGATPACLGPSQGARGQGPAVSTIPPNRSYRCVPHRGTELRECYEQFAVLLRPSSTRVVRRCYGEVLGRCGEVNCITVFGRRY